MHRGRFWLVGIMILLGLWYLPAAGQEEQPGMGISMVSEKISPTVWTATADSAVAEVLVVLQSQADVDAAFAARARTVDKATRGRAVQQALWDVAETTQMSLRAWLDIRGVAYRSFYIVNMLQLEADRALLLEIAARPEVARIVTNPRAKGDLGEPASQGISGLRITDYGLRITDYSSLSTLSIEWGVQKINAPQVWQLGYTGEGVVVAGQDTGYDWDHPALKAGYRGWDGAVVDHNYHWHDAIHSEGGVCGADSPEPCDDHGHGTHTMGTIVGDDGVGNQVGVAPGARWIGCRNMDRGYGTPATYVECFEFFLAPYPVGGDPSQGDPAFAPDVINNSWGCPPSEGCDAEHIEILRQVVQNVRAAGILVVSSAGNSGPGCGSVEDPPALYAATYTVGSTNSSDVIANSSSRGPVTVDGSGIRKPDIAAPGVYVRSSIPGGGYDYKSGTSMASPHVVGTIALVWSARPELRQTLTETEMLLNTTAVPRYSTACADLLDTVPNNVYGWGRVDALAAVERALAQGTLTGVVKNTEGEPLAGAQIQVEESLPGTSLYLALTHTQSSSTTTTFEGAYRLEMPEGTYTVSASLDTYTPVTLTDVSVSAAQTTTLNFVLTSTVVPVWEYGLLLQPASKILTGNPGTEVTYTLSLTNTGNITDTFILTYSDTVWPVQAWMTRTTLAAEGSQRFNVLVAIPPEAEDGAYDTLHITAQSQASSVYSASTTLTTTAAVACVPLAGLNLIVTPSFPEEGDVLTFTATVAMGTLPVTYTWDFGDGTAGIGNVVTHTYTSQSLSVLVPYSVTVTATNPCAVITRGIAVSLRRRLQLYLPLVLKEVR
ncbi:MAG: S8 family serine peptidase [Anaerolineae bacterium]|nr:S8 family serine peptidase [Anaerolineae bacterium]